MSEGMYVEADSFTNADREALCDLHRGERRRTEEVVREVDDGVIVEGRERREMFKFTEKSMGEWWFDVRGIKDAILAGRISTAMYRIDKTPESFYRHVLDNNGVVPERLPKITGADLERPGIMVDWNNGYQTMIDGNHRLCRRYQLGMKGFRFLLVQVADCKPHMCRPGDEEKLFERDAPDREILHAEVKIEEL